MGDLGLAMRGFAQVNQQARKREENSPHDSCAQSPNDEIAQLALNFYALLWDSVLNIESNQILFSGIICIDFSTDFDVASVDPVLCVYTWVLGI